MIEGTQQKNIGLSRGIVRTPSIGEDGELSECVNLIPHAGEMVRIPEPKEINVTLEEEEILLATNRCEGEVNYIVRSGSKIVYYREGTRKDIMDLGEGDARVTTIGQTLVVSHNHGRRYFVWQEGGEYKEQNISDVLPCVELSLGDIRHHSTNANAFNTTKEGRDVQVYVSESGYFTQDFSYDYGGSRVLYRFSDPEISPDWGYFFGVANNPNDDEAYKMDSKVLTDVIRGAYNKVRGAMKERGLACFPFYVRWGVKLYDGSVTNLSAPILMTPSSFIRPYIGLYRPTNLSTHARWGDQTEASGATWSFTPLFAARYLYAAIDATAFKDIDDKLVAGIVVYATPEIEVMDSEYEFDTLTFNRLTENDGKLTDSLGNVLNSVYNIDTNGSAPKPAYIDMVATIDAVKSDNALANAYDNLTDPTTFYELMYIPMDVLRKNKYKVVGVIGNGCFSAFKDGNGDPRYWDDKSRTDFTDEDREHYYLRNHGYNPYYISREKWSALTSQSILVDNTAGYESIDIPEANAEYNYNSRLLYGGISQRIKSSLSVSQILGENRNPVIRGGSGVVPADKSGALKVYASSSGKYLTLANTEEFMTWFQGETPVVFAPNIIDGMAFKTDVWSSSFTFGRASALGNYKTWTQLTPADLRGKLDIGSLYLPEQAVGDQWATNDATATSKKMPNAIAYTKVANPWTIEKVIELACGEIYALSSATEAVSEGQFGQFPIYAFTDNGIYALSIDTDGTIEAKQAISRDVLSSGAKVLQLDHALLFPTEAGLKLLSKPPTTLISGAISGPNVDETIFGLDLPDTQPFEKQIQNAQMVYDYAHQMVHVFGQEETEGPQKHYVYDLTSGQWATQILNMKLTTVVPGYPFSTMQFGNKLMQYDNTLDTDTVHDGWLLTRPIAFDDPFTRKMLYDVRMLSQKTHKDSKHSIAVYVSNDRQHWARLTSLKSHSVKWYRFLIKAKMNDLDTLSGIACQYVPRFKGKLR